MAPPSRSAMYDDDPTFLWKPILRFLAILLAITGIGTTAWAMTSRPHPNSNNETLDPTYYDYDDTNIFLPWQFIALGLSILWNIANISTLIARNRAIHPGANVACDLLLWLALLVTGFFATIGATNLLYDYDAYDEYGYSNDSPYGGGTYSNGTRYEYTSNGTAVPVTDSQCDGFTTCAARDRYISAVQHKGVVILVGAAAAFIVLLFHFALFISACRYTHSRRHSTTTRKARAITAEATEIARRMIADMTGPNGAFVPKAQAQQSGSYQPLQQTEAEEPMQMHRQQQQQQQQQSSSPPSGNDYQPVQQVEVEETSNHQPYSSSHEDAIQKRYRQQQAMSPPLSPLRESWSTTAVGRSNSSRNGNGPNGETHPAFRDDATVIAHAI